MGFFGNIKNVVVNAWNVSTTFDPYFKEFTRDLNSIEIVSESIDPNITRIYNQIKETAPKKYSIQINLYDTILNKLREHNKKVNEINDGMSGFSYDSIVANPHSFDNAYINKYVKIAELISSFKTYSDKYKNFKENVNTINSYYSDLTKEYDLNKNFDDLCKLSGIVDYIDDKTAEQLRAKANAIIEEINSHNKKFYPLKTINELNDKISNHNKEFIANNKGNSLFDSINGRSLDNEQREAILTDEMSTLVVAGAGSGKTLTICGKVEYLLKEKKVKPEDILLLSYSKKSANDLQQKISKINSQLTVGTFHKIGLDVLKETQNKIFMVEDQYKAIIENYFRVEMKNRPHILQAILTYYGLYIASDKHDKKYKNEGEMYEDLKKQDLSTLKSQLIHLTNDINNHETLKKEHVKSFEEMAIANWYFINGINYVYEAPYTVDVSTPDKRQYMPDFYLPDYKIYHEHYGVNKEGKAEQYEGQEAQTYVTNISWKRDIHQQYKTTCLETYSFEFDEGNIFDKLEKQLKEKGVKFSPLSDKEIFNALESIYEGQSFKSFINLIRTFLSLYKAKYRNVSGFNELMNFRFKNNYEQKRAELFLSIVKDIYQYYMNYLKKEGKIDFDDMILQSTIELDNTSNFKYKYIIVDEFQDISLSRMLFLKKLISHGNSKLFSVGDDWQAIYRFSGCDLNIFLNFKNYFGASAIVKITTTHRNSQELQDIAGPFIKANPEQFNKSINSTRHLEHPVRIMYYNDKKYYALLDVLKEISKIDAKANVLLLGRNNKDIETVSLDNRIYIDFNASKKENKTIIKVTDFPLMNISYSTVHSSKGLEEDYVIILNADDSRLGFPNKMEDDGLLDMVLSSNSNYEYAEERRLWYVALTRTRNYTYIIASADNPSIFVEEIKNQCLILNPNTVCKQNEILCPKCKSGRLVLRNNGSDNNNFYGCSNYPYCQYTIDDLRAVKRNMRCRICGDFMVYRKGEWGSFYGCHNYPRCRYTKKYIPKKIKSKV